MDSTAEESIEWDKGSTSNVRVYADRSGIDGMVGAAAVLYQGGENPKVLRYYPGPLTEHTTFDAEAGCWGCTC